MTFGEDFAKFLTEADCVTLMQLLGIKEEKHEITDETKIKLLDLLYEKDPITAILFVRRVILDYIQFVEHELIRMLQRQFDEAKNTIK
jgi:hypothetical protein